MSANYRIRVTVGVLGILTAALLTQSPALGQAVPAPFSGVKPKDKDEPRTDEFSLPIDDTMAPKIIDSVIKHLKPDLPADEWKDIIINLQALLDDPANRLVEWTDPLSKDKKPKKESIKIVVNKLI